MKSHPAFETISHRPWPLPAREWSWRQAWLDLAFIHYRADASQIEALLPPELKLQQFNGSAWLGLVPFRMSGVARRPLPVVPPFTSFPELNLRTYVERDGKPGVWFFSLDADCWPIVLGGRHVYGLPYHSARMSQTFGDDWISFSSIRRDSDVGFKARYRPVGEVFHSEPGSFEHWASERYCLYSRSRWGRLERVEVQHPPWPIQRAEVEIERCDILKAAGVSPLDEVPVCHFSSGVQVVSYAKEPLVL